MTGMAIDAMVLTIAGQAIVTGLSPKSVAGSGPARMRAPFNPSGSRTNSVNGSSARSADHVLIGINNRGKTMLYDPQTGERFTDLDSFGPFVAYPIAF